MLKQFIGIKHSIGRCGSRLLPPRAYLALCKTFDAAKSAAQFIAVQGFGRQCPCCNMQIRRFLPDPGAASPLFSETLVIGGGPSRQAICPFCGSFERERHALLILQQQPPLLSENLKLLHIAPEPRIERFLRRQRNLTYTTGDLNPARADVRVDLTSIDYSDNTFDAIIANHVLEHIPADRMAMSEIFRILRPGGWAMLQVPFAPEITTRAKPDLADPSERLRLFGQRDHVRLYGHDYPARLESIGFSVSASSIRQKFGASYANRFGLLAREQIFIASKPPALKNTHPLPRAA